MRISIFSVNVTPPLGHPLCGGWISPATEIVDPQFAHGIVLQQEGDEPVVIVAVDWCWIRSESHEIFRTAVAEQVDTAPHRVAIQCVHPHDAIIADTAADRILASAGIDLATLKGGFFEDAVRRTAGAAKEALGKLRGVTGLGIGQARVEQVASNRRILGPNGKVALWRGSACTNAQAREAPEGLIDPWLRCISFWDGEQAIAALHYYATHPMSYYGKGGVSADFCGLARERLRREQPGVHHVYFTGCAGDVSAGKYNDGSPENRPVLMERMYRAMQAAFASTRRQPVRSVRWKAEPVHLPMREEFTRESFHKQMTDYKGGASQNKGTAIKGAMGVAWWDRYEAGRKIDITCLRVNETSILHLPGEPFVAYQLFAREAAGAPEVPASAPAGAEAPVQPFVAVAGYGDCGPAYIPTAEAFDQGGYEVTMAWTGPGSEAVLKTAIRRLVSSQ